MGKVFNIVKTLTLGVWMLILSGCNDLAIFTISTMPPSMDKVSSVTVNDQGYLEVQWKIKNKAPASLYEIYLRELDTEDESFAFTSLAVMSQPLLSEEIDVSKADAPRKTGERVSSTKDSIYTFDKILDPSKRYLVQISERGRIKPKASEKAILIKVEFEKFTGASAVALSDGVELNWSVVPGANRYDVYADKELTILIGSTEKTKLLFKPTADLSPKEFYVKAYRGLLASLNVERITFSTSAVKVTRVTSTSNAGVYTAGAALDFEVVFNEKVNMFGTSTLPLMTATGTREALYVTGNGTAKILYRYVVQAGDNTEDLQNGTVLSGNFVDAVGLDVSGALPETGSNATLAENSALVLDTIAPTAPSSVGFNTALSSTGAFDVSWNVGTDAHLGAHKLKLCSDTACSTACTGPVAVTGATKSLTGIAEGSYHACVQSEDAAGLTSLFVSSISQIRVDVTAPQVVRVFGDSADGRYKEGDIIDLSVEFTEPVTVTSPLQLALKVETGVTDRDAAYVSGSASTILKFRYTIAPGDGSNDLNYVGIGSLTVGSGSIKDSAGNNATVTLPATGNGNALALQSAIIVDTTAPTAPTAVHFAGALSATTSFSLLWNDAVDPNLKQHNVKICSAADCATCISAGTSPLSPAVMTGVNGASYYGCVQGEDHLGHLTNWIASAATITVDTSLPGVIDVTSSTADGTYDVPTVISLQVKFSEAVNVAGGTPVIELETGATNHSASYVSGTGTDTLTFDYTVQPNDSTQDLSYASVSALTLAGATIRDSSLNNADLALPSVGSGTSLSGHKAIKLDTINPTAPANVTLAGAYSTTSSLGVTWDESEDDNFTTHNLKLCTNSLCTLGCAGATTDTASPGAIAGSEGVAYYACIQGVDTLGHTSAWIASSTTGIIDTVSPTVTSVSSTKADGYYALGTVIPITVTFSEPVTLTTPAGIALQLETGASDRSAIYTSATSTVLTLNYTVGTGDISADLDYLATTSLSLGGASIRDAAGNTATLTLPALGGGQSIATPKAIVIDTTAPTNPSSVGFSTAAVNSTTFNMAWTSGVETNFAQYNTKICTASNCTTCTSIGTSAVLTKSMTGVNNATYYGCVQAQDLAGQTSDWVNSVGTIRVDTDAPTVTAVSSTLGNASYKANQVIPITVQFSEIVAVLGDADVKINLSPGTARSANYASGSGTTTLTFNYTVQAGDTSSDLDYVGQTSLVVGSGSIRDVAGSDATLTLAVPGAAGSLSHAKTLIIDTTAPVAPTISTPTAAQYLTSNLHTITGTSESGASIEVFRSGVSIGTVAASGTTWTLNLATDLTDGNHSITAAATDAAGNVGDASGARTFLVDTSPPAVPVITTTATTTNDNTPDISGTADVGATITLYSGTGVSAGTATADGSGNWTVTSASRADATYSYTATATDGGGRTSAVSSAVAIIIDTVAPTVLSVTSTTSDGTYGIGSSIQTQITFSEAVSYTSNTSHYVRLEGSAGVGNPYVYFNAGSGTATISGSFTVASGQSSADLQYVGTGSLAGTYTDAAGNTANLTLPALASANSLGGSKAIVIDGIPAVISSVTSNLADGDYGPGNVVDVRVTFSKTVNVASGTPTLALNTSPVRAASYASGTGSTTLVFNYTVQTGDTAADLNATSLSLVGATIRDSLNNNATLTVPASQATGSLDLAKAIVIAGNSVVPVLSASVASQNAYTLSAVGQVDINANASTDNDADGQAVTYTCLFDKTANSGMDSGGTACTSLPNSSYSFNVNTGIFNWTPTAAAVTNNSSITTYEFQIRGTDTTHLTGTTYFTVSLLNPFTTPVNFTTADITNYTFDSGAIDFSGDVAKLKTIDTLDNDNTATGYGGATGVGARWYSVSDFTRTDLIPATNCDGRTRNCAGFGSMSWMPDAASLVASHSFETNYEGWSNAGYPDPARDTTVRKVGHYSLLFSGGSNRLEKARVVTDTFTINFWMKSTQSATDGDACVSADEGASMLGQTNKDTLTGWGIALCGGYVIAGTSGPITNVKTPIRFNDGLWHMISFTRNMATGEIKLYVDAILQASATGGTSSLTAVANWYLGSLPLALRYEGHLDELNAWTTVLSEKKLAYIFERQRPDSAGYSVSRVMDSFQSSTNWTSLNWTTTRPYGKPLPDYNAGAQNESASNYNEILHTSTHTSLVGLYHFEEPADASAPGGTYFKDSSVSANHGNFVVSSGTANTVQFDKAGIFQRGLFFPGTGAVNLGTTTTTDFGNAAFSLSFWIRTHTGGRHLIGSKAGPNNTGIDANLDATGNIVFGLGCANGSTDSQCAYIQTTGVNYADGTWHHILLMNDKTYNVMKIFVDGRVKPVARHGTYGGCLTMQNGSQEGNFSTCSVSGDRSGTGFYVGSFEGLGTPYIGYLDEFAIWKKRLDNGMV